MRSAESTASDVVLLDIDDLDAGDTGASVDNTSLVICLLFLGMTIVFSLLYFYQRVPKRVHKLRISHEGFAAYSLGKHLTEFFERSTGSSPVETVILAPDVKNQYTSEFLDQLSGGLDPSLISIREIYTFKPLIGAASDNKLTTLQLYDLIDRFSDVGLIISLGSVIAIDDQRWQGRQRPYIAVWSDKAEFNDHIDLINRGIIDVVVISRGTFEHHSIIPASLTLDEIFENNFLLVTVANVKQIAKEYKQTISVRIGEN